VDNKLRTLQRYLGGSAGFEQNRFEWRVGDSGDPAQLLEDFLAAAGLPVRDLSALSGSALENDPDVTQVTATAQPHAVLLLSAAAGASMVGAPTGRPSPAPEVPDLVAVVRHGGEPEVPPRIPGTRTPASSLRVGAWTPSWSPAEHAAAVESVRSAIARGDVYQANVVGHQSAPYAGDPAGALARVAGLPGAVYGGRLGGDGWAVATGSPECLVTVLGGEVVTRPIKGTRPRDARGRAELYASAKERAEHVMIVDLERNDLARVARTGTVRVDELYALRPWCDLWQAESTVRAELRPGVGLAELLRAVFPGGSVTGAPKLSALDLIAGLEPVGRGPSMGALGYVSQSGLDLGLTIRTVAATPDRLHLWAGGGITWGSDPAAEVAEAAAKADPVRRAIAAQH
jgi:para-aminobenzoate synthetase component 1